MRKGLFIGIVIVLAVVGSEVKGQSKQLIQKGNIDVAPTLGIGGAGYLGSGLRLPMTIMGEYGLNDKLSVGAFVGVTRTGEGAFTYTYMAFGPRVSYHFANYLDDIPDNMDFYGGLSVYYNVVTVSDGKILSDSAFVPALHAGANYFLNESLAANVELGYSNAWLKIGALVRF